jgi:hypothetical protein
MAHVDNVGRRQPLRLAGILKMTKTPPRNLQVRNTCTEG